jgi:uncharacterized protein
VRRAKCEIIDQKEMIEILNGTSIGRLATVDSDGYPYVTPVKFVYYQDCVYFHSATEGEKIDNLARNPRVCFEVDLPLAYLGIKFNPEKDPCRSHQLYRSVIIRGNAKPVPDGEIKTEVLNALVEKHEGNSDFSPITRESAGYKACRVIEITPIRMTGKSELGQSLPQVRYRDFIAQELVRRGLPGDLETVQAMGYDLEKVAGSGWKLRM